jgi:hypothetical protein
MELPWAAECCQLETSLVPQHANLFISLGLSTDQIERVFVPQELNEADAAARSSMMTRPTFHCRASALIRSRIWSTVQWPGADRRAWEDACRPGSRLKPGGAASRLVQVTRDTIAWRYGVVLGFMQKNGRLNCDAAAASQVGPLLNRNALTYRLKDSWPEEQKLEIVDMNRMPNTRPQ